MDQQTSHTQQTGPEPSPVATPTNGLAVAALVLGIISLLGGLFFVGGFFGIAAIVLGIIGLKHPGGKGLSIAGIILGALGTIGSIIMFILLFIGISIFGAVSNEVVTNVSDYTQQQ